MQIGDKKIGHGQPCFIIAEIGINHNGSLNIAKKLIDVAVDSGCDAVKFQKRTIDIVYSKEELAIARESVFGKTNGDLKYGLEFSVCQYKEIDLYCKSKGILWLASPWDLFSVDFLEDLNVCAYKVASARIGHLDLLNRINSTNKSVILSTGMTTLDEIKRAICIFDITSSAILHCVSVYPAKDEMLNLRCIETLRTFFPDSPVGYSSHGYGTTLVVCAVALGASIIEAHITLDRTMWGSDQSASLEPNGLRLLVTNIRRLEKALGDGRKAVLPEEIPIRQKLWREKD